MKLLFLCQPGYENFLAREVEARRAGEVTIGEIECGFVQAEVVGDGVEWLEKLCFPHLTLIEPVEVGEKSVNAMAGRLLDLFLQDFGDVRVEGNWYLDAWVRRDLDGLGKRAASVKSAFAENLKKRMARVARLGSRELPAEAGLHRGWVMFFQDFGKILASSRVWVGGQRRMADDPAAPSRSFLKVEEAYRVLGRGPAEGERVVDLGAAPGGWSFSAARRGASVDAVDNGPLKAGAADNPLIRHLREDGFTFGPEGADEGYDWLFCDMVEDPFRVLRLLEQWVERGWCRHFVVNLKFGRTNPLMLLEAVAQFRERALEEWPTFRARHLFHDREEITLVGDSG